MTKILRAFSRSSYKTQQGGPAPRFGQNIAISDNTFIQGGKRRVTSRVGVRRLFVRDPYNLNSVSGIGATGATQATFSPVADQFTNNPNPSFDPSKAPGAVREVSARQISVERPGKAGRGHQKVVTRTLFNQNLGKRLKRR